ncbi:hypothetical protein AB0K09_24445 [Streptomyces sp. NPDC049577]|uniref:hypothetical protein n=1 Tax=Streptomyces sp. NPDC049577 TaxID=3155153 RepID=UPI00342C7D78
MARPGCTWQQWPPMSGLCRETVQQRFAQWSRARVWARLHCVVLDELHVGRAGTTLFWRGVRESGGWSGELPQALVSCW